MATTYVMYHIIEDDWSETDHKSYTLRGNNLGDIPLSIGRPSELANNTLSIASPGLDLHVNSNPMQGEGSDYLNLVKVTADTFMGPLSGTLHIQIAVVWSTIDS